MNFKKMHGLGNDFVILDQRGGVETLSDEQVRRISDRRHGVGCDQLIVMESSEAADLFMRIYNPDGSQAEACGNATRCVSHLYMSEQGAQTCTIETVRGVLNCELRGNLVRVDMGKPVEVKLCDKTMGAFGQGTIVNVGNPHIVFFVDNAEAIKLAEIGPTVENHVMFPGRTNVEFAHVKNDGSIRLRVWERGTGITQACGSGACATMIAAVDSGAVLSNSADIHMDGGMLSMEYERGGAVFMTGPVSYVFDGVSTL